jgi:hypothetical protein
MTGYTVVRVRMKTALPPASVSDDANGTIFRVTRR